ncbi:Oidioi.mRNA.OKI2018_I69.chr2.g5810.t1.cds [Oikopleura dioica]|uniref:Oidioi.mRNA.OKI2018_I69.chr2.g5810.t1.cds n=1 Tax=Oikopleura dioica TaxID=34765 RepID=A0ABN7T518_OIKDI|nr:Oidioi.mRNA.OKI2018_I69.chr2.g5810.t1.cds [Oikopleura dioica]
MAVQLCSTKASNHEKHDGRYFKLKSSKLLFMIVLYIVFLLIGAGVFNFIEQKAEHQRCKTSRDTVRQAVDKMTDEYFYLLNVNLKICKGIKAVKEGDTSEFNAVLLEGLLNNFSLNNNRFEKEAKYKSYIYDWAATNCSREGQRIFSEKSDLYNKQEDTANEFQQLWGTVMQKSDLKHFDDEVFTISGKPLDMEI